MKRRMKWLVLVALLCLSAGACRTEDPAVALSACLGHRR